MGGGKELIKQRGSPQPKPGHDDDGHYVSLLAPGRVAIGARVLVRQLVAGRGSG